MDSFKLFLYLSFHKNFIGARECKSKSKQESKLSEHSVQEDN